MNISVYSVFQLAIPNSMSSASSSSISSDLIPYETRVLDPEGMLPEVAGEDEPGGDDGGDGAGDGPGGGSG